MKLTPRQRLSAAYFQLQRIVFRTMGPEFYAIVEHEDMAGRHTFEAAHVGFNMPLDWRSTARAHRNTLVYVWILMISLVIGYQDWAAVKMGLSLSSFWWWLPGGLIPTLFAQGFSSVTAGPLGQMYSGVQMPAIPALHAPTALAFPIASLPAFFIGWMMIAGLHRYIIFTQSMDRAGLSTEHGSTYFALPPEMANSDPKENMYPPGYDIYGGFDDQARRARVLDLEAIDAFKADVRERKRRALVEDIALDLPAPQEIQVGPGAAKPAPAAGLGMEEELRRLMAGG